MTIIPLTGGVNPFPALREAARRPGIIPLLADRDLTARGVQVDFCGHRRADGARPGRARAGRAPPAAPGVDPARAARPRLGDRHHLPPGRRVPRAGTTRERATAMTQACADVLGAAVREHTADWHMLPAGLRRRPRPRPARPRGRRPREDRHRLPLLLGRPGRGAVPRARPGGALHRPGPRRVGARPGRRRVPPPGLPHVVRSGGSGALQRVRRPGHVRAGDVDPGDPVARGGLDSTCSTSTSRVDARRPRCMALWAADRAGGRHVPRRHAALARHARGEPAAAPLAGEDPRPHRRVGGGAGHRAAPPRRRGVHHPERGRRRPLRPRRRDAADWVGTPERPTLAFLGRVDEPRKGLGVALRALPAVLDRHPGTRLLVAGPG